MKHDDLQGCVIVLDTNVLQQTALLRDPLSKSLLQYLAVLNAHIGLPSVVRDEWSSHWAAKVEEQHVAHTRASRWLSQDFTDFPVASFDAREAADRVFHGRLLELGHVIQVHRLVADHYKAAGDMVIRQLPPSTASSQQFKDSLLWRSVLHFGSERHCLLVTHDKGFCEERSSDLASSLRQEAADVGATITLVRGLKDLLELLKAAVGEVDKAIGNLVEQNAEDIQAEFLAMLRERLDGFAVPEVAEWNVSLFPVQEPEEVTIYVEAVVTFEVDEFEYGHQLHADVTGSVLYNPRSGSMLPDLDSVHVWQSTPHGEFEVLGYEPWTIPSGRHERKKARARLS